MHDVLWSSIVVSDPSVACLPSNPQQYFISQKEFTEQHVYRSENDIRECCEKICAFVANRSDSRSVLCGGSFSFVLERCCCARHPSLLSEIQLPQPVPVSLSTTTCHRPTAPHPHVACVRTPNGFVDHLPPVAAAAKHSTLDYFDCYTCIFSQHVATCFKNL